MICLDDNTVWRLIEGRLSPAALVDADAHLDGCLACREVVAQVARAQGSASGGSDAGVLARGQVIGRYVVGDLLGAGAMGRVYSAWEPELDRRVALKVLRDDVIAADGARHPMVREAQAMARLAHPNVVTVHEVGTIGDAVFVAMELVDGETLRSWGATRRPWREIAATLGETARGLAAVHAAGVVHRDIKPDNVIVGADRRVRLGDFGLARARGRSDDARATAPTSRVVAGLAAGTPAAPVGSGTSAGAVAGTPAYMAPEVLRGKAATSASDQFSFGVTGWELLHGRRPFAGKTWDELATAAEAAAFTAPSAEVPGWFDAIVRRCLAADPDRRFGSMREVADAIAAGLARRRSAPWIVAGAGLVVLACVATYLVAAHPPAAPGGSCDRGGAEIAAVTGTLPAAIGTTGTAAVTGWTRTWGDTRDLVCRGAAAQPARAAVQDRCLDQRRRELIALLARVDRDSTASRDRFVDALAALPSPDECRTLAAGDGDPRPLDPDRIADVRSVETGLAAIRAATALGDARAVLADAADLVDRARASGHAPTLATALLVETEAVRGAGRLDDASAMARDAVIAAERGHADAAAAAAWVERVVVAGDRRELAAADDLAELAAAAVARAGDPPHLVARLLQVRGMIAYNRGDLGDARALLEDARARQVALAGEGTVEVARIDSALGLVARADDRLDDAEARLRAVLSVDQALRGAGHPILATDLHNIAGVLRRRGDLTAALATYRQALAIEQHGPDPAAAGLTHNSIGLVLMARGEWAAAGAELAIARDVLTTAGHADRAIAEHNLGLVAQALADHRGALAHFARAGEIYATTIGADAPPAVRLLLDRAVSERALGHRAAARELAGAARSAAADLDGAGWIADAAAVLLGEPAGASAPPRPVAVVEPPPAPLVADPPPPQVTQPPPDAAPAPAPMPVDAAPRVRKPGRRDVGVYGAGQGF